MLGDQASKVLSDAIELALTRDALGELDLEEMADEELGSPLDESVDRAARADLVTRGLARFLTETEPSAERLSAAGDLVERNDLDLELLGELVAKSSTAESWRRLLGILVVSVTSIDGDKYRAVDDATAWQTELRKSVPAWRSGNFPIRGYREQLVASSLLGALDVQAWLHFLDRLPLPGLIEAMLWYRGASPSQLKEWLAISPPAFNPEGKRTGSSLVYLFERALCKQIEDLVERSSEKEAVSNTAPLQTELAATLASRIDGAILLVELGAHKLLRSQAFAAETTYEVRRREFQRSLAEIYAAHVGGTDLAALCHRRVTEEPARSHLGLWLVHRYGMPATDAHSAARSWAWLVKLMVDRDVGITQRHSDHWTHTLGGQVLATVADPTMALEKCWQDLAEQRQRVSQNPYETDTFSTSRFLVRVAFCAARILVSAQLWKQTMGMAITLWLSSVRDDEFAGVRIGLAHLAAGKLEIPGEPTETLEYLVGDRDAFGDAAAALLDNEFDVSQLQSCATAAGIDAIVYVRLLANRTQSEQRARLLEHFNLNPGIL